MRDTPVESRTEIDDSPNPTTASPESATATKAVPDLSGDAPRYESEPGYRDRGAQMGEMLGQLQSMIDNLSRQAAPVVRQATPVLRQVAAKAAELAAVAAERAGPIAHRAADVTEDLGVRVATRSREVAAELRAAEQAQETDGKTGVYPTPGAEPAGSSRSTDGTERPPTTTGL
jgi:hypothetical protein